MNLADNLSFVSDAIVLGEYDEADNETKSAALVLAQHSWNSKDLENQIDTDHYKQELRKLELENPRLWDQLAGRDATNLIDTLIKRKMVFFPEDKRTVKTCCLNAYGTVTVVEDNEEETIHVEGAF